MLGKLIRVERATVDRNSGRSDRLKAPIWGNGDIPHLSENTKIGWGDLA